MLKIHLLGHFKVLKEEDTIAVPSRPAQSLFAYLVMSAGTTHRREKLAGLLWPEANESNARSNLRHALWRLRKAVGNEYFIADKISVSFDGRSEYWLDVAALSGEDEEEQTTEGLLKDISIYGGELLPGFYDDWVILERERYRALFDKRVQHLLDRLVEEERWTDVLEWGERWIAMGYAPEPAYRALMFAYCGLGDTAGMANTYQRCVKSLKEELGVEPSGETKAAYEYLVKGGKPTAPQWAATTPAREVDATTAVHTLLKQWRTQGADVLDIASLAIVQASPSKLPFEDADVSLLVRSALHHAVEVGPWLERVRTEDVAVEALMEVYDSYPKPRIRSRIVEAMKGLESEAATQGLLRIAMQDDAGSVRSEAAVAAAGRGQLKAVVDGLLEEVNSRGGVAAMAAFVAVADEIGLPDNVGSYPKVSVGTALAQRRWREDKSLILKQTIRAALGGALAMALVANLQIIPSAWMTPDLIDQYLEFTTLPVWIFSNALLGLMWGGLLGAAMGFFVSLGDSLWSGKSTGKWRYFLGGLAGLVHSFFLILMSLSGGLKPMAEASVYVPVYLFYGLLIGGVLSRALPTLGVTLALRRQVIHSMGISAIVAIVAAPTVYVVYREQMATALVLHFLFALLFPMGLAAALSGAKKNVIGSA